jgi:transposase
MLSNMENQELPKVKFVVKAYTKKELRLMYGNVSRSTFTRWLKQIPETANSGKTNWLDVNQVTAILKKHGVPGEREFD